MLPSNVGLDGVVGSAADGKWCGGGLLIFSRLCGGCMVVLNTATAAAYTRAGAAAAPEKSIARTSHGVSLMEGTGYNTNAPRACRYGGCYGWGFAVDTNYATGKTDGPGPPRHVGRPPFCTAIPLRI